MRKPKLILAATTDADQSESFYHDGKHQKSLVCNPILAGSEKGTLQMSIDDGTTWINALTGRTPECNELSITTTIICIEGPGLYRVDKDASAGATAIYLNEGHS